MKGEWKVTFQFFEVSFYINYFIYFLVDSVALFKNFFILYLIFLKYFLLFQAMMKEMKCFLQLKFYYIKLVELK